MSPLAVNLSPLAFSTPVASDSDKVVPGMPSHIQRIETSELQESPSPAVQESASSPTISRVSFAVD